MKELAFCLLVCLSLSVEGYHLHKKHHRHHHNHNILKDVKASKKQYMPYGYARYYPRPAQVPSPYTSVNTASRPYTSVNTASYQQARYAAQAPQYQRQATVRSCCQAQTGYGTQSSYPSPFASPYPGSFPSYYPSSYPVAAPAPYPQPAYYGPFPVQESPNCCQSSNPPNCCINLKPGDSKKLALEAGGQKYILSINLDASSKDLVQTQKDSSPQPKPTTKAHNDSSPQTKPTTHAPNDSSPQSKPTTHAPNDSSPKTKPTTQASSAKPTSPTATPTPTQSAIPPTGLPINSNDTSSTATTTSIPSQSSTPVSPTPSSAPTGSKASGDSPPKQDQSKHKDVNGNDDSFSKQLEQLNKEIDKIDLDTAMKQDSGLSTKQGDNNGEHKDQEHKNDKGKTDDSSVSIIVGEPLMEPNPDQDKLLQPEQQTKPLKDNSTSHGLHPQQNHNASHPNALPKKHNIESDCTSGMNGMSQCMPQQQMAAPAMSFCPQQCPQQTVACQTVAAPPCPQPQEQAMGNTQIPCEQENTMECIPESPCSQTPCPTSGINPCGQETINAGACLILQGVTCCPVNETSIPNLNPGQGGGNGAPAPGQGQGQGKGPHGNEGANKIGAGPGGKGGHGGGMPGRGGGRGGGAPFNQRIGGGGGGDGGGGDGGGVPGRGGGRGGGAPFNQRIGGGGGDGGGGDGGGVPGRGGGGGAGAGGPPPGPGAAAPPGSCAQQSLNRHNLRRREHGVPPLRLNADMNRSAQQYARKLAATRTGNLQHSSRAERPGQGENLAMTCQRGGNDCRKVTDNWYNEINKYNYNAPGFSMGTGHFTQVVWKNTKELGIGMATYPDPRYGTCYMIVARYKPPGNVQGQFPQNVPRKTVG